MFSAPSNHQGGAGAPSCPFRHVLVGWDGSPGSVAAMKMAVAILGTTPGRVAALAVLPEPRQSEDGRGTSAGAGHAWEAFGFAEHAAAAGCRARISLHTAHGRHVAESICGYAAEHGFDLLVLGRHGGGGLLHSKLGHIAEAAARSATIPVLLVSAS